MIEKEGIRIIMADTDPDNLKAVNFFTKKGLSDQRPHLYMASNLEQNPRYRELVKKYRDENNSDSDVSKKKARRKGAEKKRPAASKKPAITKARTSKNQKLATKLTPARGRFTLKPAG
jgi:chromatin segregation and condensation protein Rec8/ScpA/Scc1 (kleisin family)